jgi:hypothetical protein
METSGFHSTADGTRKFWRTVGVGAQTVMVLHGGPAFHMNYLISATGLRICLRGHVSPRRCAPRWAIGI